MALDEATTAFLTQMAAAGSPPIYEQTPVQARELGTQLIRMYGPGPAVHDVQNTTLTSEDGGSFAVRVLRPTPEPAAVIVYFHGGGWVVGDIDGYDTLGRQLAKSTNSTVVLVDYRKAPESPFPAAVHDAWSALSWADEYRDDLAGNRAPLVVAGDSAGANLAAVMTQKARDTEGGPVISLQVLVYPVTDFNFDTPSYVDPQNQLMLSRRSMQWFWDQYLPDESLRSNPLASPLNAESLSDLPPAVVLTAEHDPLRDEGEAYASRLAESGVDVRRRRFDGQMHGFFSFVNILPGSADALEYISAAVAETLGKVTA